MKGGVVKRKQGCVGFLVLLWILVETLNQHVGNGFAFVKKVQPENGNFDLALRKRLFCNAKPTLLPCKTAAFGMQNNRFYNALITRRLCDSCACEKYLQYLWVF
ncbi:hypothetical protein CTM62_11285 [Prevotella intermedia]|uniref:Uncharacterized protein n=1 Tax=Prevotella intermedia TaxID=28131 RepID=A0A2D3L9X5_PREIN|nr:hypothetical protein CTM62_11285 [Prevotella intermedia]